MVVEALKQGIDCLVTIMQKLEHMARNDRECTKIREQMERLHVKLKIIEKMPMFLEGENQMVLDALQRLNITLNSTRAEVMKLQDNSSKFVKFFSTNGIAKKLDKLKEEITAQMDDVVFVNGISNTSMLHEMRSIIVEGLELLRQEGKLQRQEAMLQRQELDGLNLLVGAVISQRQLESESLVRLLEQRISDSINKHTRNKNKRKPDKGNNSLKSYTWSAMDAAIDSSKEDIGGGHLSDVYKVKLNKEEVAIKIFRNASKPDVRERFVDELKLVSKLRHENIAGLLGYCYQYNESLVTRASGDVRVKNNGHLGFVSTYMSNESLMIRVIKGNQRQDCFSLFLIILGIANGINYLHEQGVVHLDLKPETILLDADMTAKINDFGKARRSERVTDEITPDTNNLPGRERYMAPELSSDKPRASTKSDVYSFGVILLETISLMCAASEKGRPRGREEWVNRMQETEWRSLFDETLVTNEDLVIATRCVVVGLTCCVKDPALRPLMQEVVGMLVGRHMEEKGKKSAFIAASSTQSQKNGGSKGKQVAVKGAASSSHSLPDDSRIGTSVCGMERNYRVLSHEDLRARQSVTLPETKHKVMTNTDVKCGKCKGSGSGGEMTMRSASCSHYYCQNCWCWFISEAVNKDKLPMCPYNSCQMHVPRTLVMEVAEMPMVHLYDTCGIQSYVRNSGGKIKWCDGCRGTHAIEFLGGSGGDSSSDVFCECKHGFCRMCDIKEPHQPLSCKVAKVWLDMNKSKDSQGNNSLYKRYYDLWQESCDLRMKALDDLKGLNTWLENMARKLGVSVTDLNFLVEAFGEIAEIRCVIQWVYAYGYFMESGRDRKKKIDRFSRLLEEANVSLNNAQTDVKNERVKLCADDVEDIIETYPKFKTMVLKLTAKARQDLHMLLEAIRTDFQAD